MSELHNQTGDPQLGTWRCSCGSALTDKGACVRLLSEYMQSTNPDGAKMASCLRCGRLHLCEPGKSKPPTD